MGLIIVLCYAAQLHQTFIWTGRDGGGIRSSFVD